MSDLIFVVVEHSAAGDSVLGVFSTIERARAQLPPVESGRLEDYRVEAHRLDEPAEARTPWQIALSREGEVESAGLMPSCNCEDDQAHYWQNSFIEKGGERMNVVVIARSPGEAIAAARDYHAWLINRRLWSDEETPLQPLDLSALPAS